MTFQALSYFTALLIATILTITISFLAFRRLPRVGALPLVSFMLLVGGWTFTQMLEDIISNYEAKLFLLNIKFSIIALLPIVWLVLTLQYAKLGKAITGTNMCFISAIPLTTTVLIWTNSLHSFFMYNISIETTSVANHIVFTKGDWFWIHTFYSYVLVLCGIYLLIKTHFHQPRAYRVQTALLITASIIPLLTNILCVFNLTELQHCDFTPLVMVISALLVFVALFKHKLLDFVPIARHTIIENMEDPIIVLDMKNRITYTNPAFLNLINIKGVKFIGQHISQIPSPWSKILEGFSDGVKPNEKFSLNIGNIKKCYFLKQSHIYNQKQTLADRLIVIRDITELEMTMEQLAVSRNNAESASRAKSQFLSNMSHEIRTPLNAIMGMSELLASSGLSSEQKEHLGIISEATDTLLKIINSILDLSKIEAGKLDIESIDFDLYKLINETIKTMSVQAASKDIELTCSISEDTPCYIVGDPSRIRQILINLIGNAIKFTNVGKVEVRVKSDEVDNVRTTISFSVSDTGIGIPQSKIDMLFEAFSPHHSSNTKKLCGTGVGLTIVKNLVEIMGGILSAQSTLGKGSTFSFRIPFLISAKKVFWENIAIEEPNHLLAKTNAHILLAEDNKVNQILMLKILQKLGYKVDVADNGRIVLDMIKQYSYDLILMDIQMPEMDGLEVTKIIREKEKQTSRHIPVIALTASAMTGDRERCIESGMDDYLPKPIRSQTLSDMLQKYIP